MPRILEQFGRAVNDIMERRNLSNRAAMRKTQIDYTTINNMRQGMVPRKGVIVDWAIGLGENVNKWLLIAEYDPIPLDLVVTPEDADRIAEARASYSTQAEEFEIKTVSGVRFAVERGTVLSESDLQKIARIIKKSSESA